ATRRWQQTDAHLVVRPLDLLGVEPAGPSDSRLAEPRLRQIFRAEEELDADLQLGAGVEADDLAERVVGPALRAKVAELRGGQRTDRQEYAGVLNPGARADDRVLSDRVVAAGDADVRALIGIERIPRALELTYVDRHAEVIGQEHVEAGGRSRRRGEQARVAK